MTVEVKTEMGRIEIVEDVIATIAGGAAMECYGVVGMVSQHLLKDGIIDLLGKENLSRGVLVEKKEDQVNLNIYIMVSYGTRISEIAHNVQTRVKYTLEQTVGIHIGSVNVFVQGVKVV
ncbi:Asp23/Gls24 family envelope stress response protein [Microaerobacter geothermalis]|uniref:Asp23/Gls24 family envelope stress response protein n=1 Tax=Microaerobacter geothermalis TaxID=674972 RepID=UPI001F39429C|nr:Asp23/Gls24 family envelope stress response protein [Microaerobacter geothermalis]MCF6095060.1 Asp23/Gls24 family envelope stress response protein [Microaerobacter geothermalis]